MANASYDLTLEIPVQYKYRLASTYGVFEIHNHLLMSCFTQERSSTHLIQVLVFLDEGVAQAQPDLVAQIQRYFQFQRETVSLVGPPVLVPGGEEAKHQSNVMKSLLQAIHDAKLCRHSYVVAIGGGAVLDVVCFAASIAHRGVRQVRLPTTVLAQADAGIGIKNGVNAFGKKNYLGTFTPPQAVINDSRFLATLSQRDWISGIAEAIKVGLIRDREFFFWIHENGTLLQNRNLQAIQILIQKSAELHLRQISQGGDPLEKGSARPLDFGHWVAHKLEQLSQYQLTHGHAVAIGIAIDSIYSYRKGYLPRIELDWILDCLEKVGFELSHPLVLARNEWSRKNTLLDGLEEFREHLGGQLTVSLLKEIGQSLDVHEIDEDEMMESMNELMRR